MTAPFRQITAAGCRTVNAVWLAPVLLFAVLAPQQTGACAERVALRFSGGQLPPWLIVLVIVGHLSLLWWIVVFFAFPWILGGAAAQFAEQLTRSGNCRGYVEQAKRLYGRSLALWILLGIILAMLFLSIYAVPMWLTTRNDGVFSPDDLRLIFVMASHPVMLACSVAWWLAAAVVVTACDLVLAMMALDDQTLPLAARRSLSFVRSHPRDATQLWLFVMLLGLPDVVIQQTLVLVPMPAAMVLAIGIGIAAYNAYAILLTVAVAEALLLSRQGISAEG